MKALLLRSGDLRVDQVEDPTPETGQVVVRSLACSICASDHHMVHHAHRLSEWSRAHDGPFDFDPDADVILGHEVCGEVVAIGPGAGQQLAVGNRVVSQPIVLHDRGFAVLGYSNTYAGGFAEYLALSEALCLPVPDGLPTEVATLMEPLSVGFQYARIGDPQPGEVPLVIGCGAIGLAVIAGLRRRGIGPIVAADFSPLRRELAGVMGADTVVDPADDNPYAVWQRTASPGARALVFECVGAPGVLNTLFAEAPWGARVVVAGQCLDDDVFFTASAHTKGLNVQFGGSPIPGDYADALAALAAGDVDVQPWITGEMSLDDAVEAFAVSADATTHTRVLVRP